MISPSRSQNNAATRNKQTTKCTCNIPPQCPMIPLPSHLLGNPLHLHVRIGYTHVVTKFIIFRNNKWHVQACTARTKGTTTMLADCKLFIRKYWSLIGW
eukprot:sb/3478761/